MKIGEQAYGGQPGATPGPNVGPGFGPDPNFGGGASSDAGPDVVDGEFHEVK